MKFIICLLLFIGLTGCGLKGSLYIPNENSVLKPIRNRLIKKHFNGHNYKELAKEFKISEMQVRNIIHIK